MTTVASVKQRLKGMFYLHDRYILDQICGHLQGPVACCCCSESPAKVYYEEATEPCSCLREERMLQMAMCWAYVVTFMLCLTLISVSIIIAKRDLTLKVCHCSDETKKVGPRCGGLHSSG